MIHLYCKKYRIESLCVFKRCYVITMIFALIVLYFWSYDGLNSVLADHQKNRVINSHLCTVQINDTRRFISGSDDLNMIYFVTPTYPRPEQIPELTRLAHTLMHVPRLHWIVADDQPLCSHDVLNILKRSGLPFTHISSPKPYKYKGTNFPRGVSNRRAALLWINSNVKDGVLYFGDDDNTLDLQLFEEIRKTEKFSMLPVGLIGEYGVSSPVVKDGKVAGFFDSWPASRTFPVDMAGFAINIQYLTPSASMPFTAGYEEDRFLVSLGFKVEDIEPLAENCTKVLVWHTRTYKYKRPTLKIDLDKLNKIPMNNNFGQLIKEVSKLGMVKIDSYVGTKPYITHNDKTYDPIALK